MHNLDKERDKLSSLLLPSSLPVTALYLFFLMFAVLFLPAWERHERHNCHAASDGGGGAVKAPGNYEIRDITLDSCKASCSRLSGCHGVGYTGADKKCLRLSNIQLHQCNSGPEVVSDTYLLVATADGGKNQTGLAEKKSKLINKT